MSPTWDTPGAIQRCPCIRLSSPRKVAQTVSQGSESGSGTGSAVGSYKVTVRGVCTAVLPGGLNYLQDDSGAIRSGAALYAPMNPLTVGHQYLAVVGVQEYYNETELTANVYLRDEGPATLPAPISQTVAVLADSTCDVAKAFLSGEDYEGLLVKLNY